MPASATNRPAGCSLARRAGSASAGDLADLRAQIDAQHAFIEPYGRGLRRARQNLPPPTVDDFAVRLRHAGIDKLADGGLELMVKAVQEWTRTQRGITVFARPRRQSYAT